MSTIDILVVAEDLSDATRATTFAGRVLLEVLTWVDDVPSPLAR